MLPNKHDTVTVWQPAEVLQCYYIHRALQRLVAGEEHSIPIPWRSRVGTTLMMLSFDYEDALTEERMSDITAPPFVVKRGFESPERWRELSRQKDFGELLRDWDRADWYDPEPGHHYMMAAEDDVMRQWPSIAHQLTHNEKLVTGRKRPLRFTCELPHVLIPCAEIVSWFDTFWESDLPDKIRLAIDPKAESRLRVWHAMMQQYARVHGRVLFVYKSYRFPL